MANTTTPQPGTRIALYHFYGSVTHQQPQGGSWDRAVWEVERCDESRKVYIRRVGKKGSVLAVSPKNYHRVSVDLASRAEKI